MMVVDSCKKTTDDTRKGVTGKVISRTARSISRRGLESREKIERRVSRFVKNW